MYARFIHDLHQIKIVHTMYIHEYRLNKTMAWSLTH